MPINLDQEIQKVDAEILALRSKLPALQTSYSEWFAQSQVKCDQIIKSKKDACLADKQFKLNNAESVKTQIRTIELEIENKLSYRQTLINQKASQDKQAETLASQGLSSGALMVKAEAEAKAIASIAEAQAKTVTDNSASDNTRKNIIISVVVVVVIITAVIIYRKFKKK